MTDIAMPRLTIGRIVVPATLDAPDAGPFLEMVRIANAVCQHDAGHDDLRQEPTELLGFWQDQTDWGQTGFWAEGVEEALLAAAEDEAKVLGRAIIQTWTLHRPGTPGPKLTPSTGWGEIPAQDRQTVFQRANGFSLEQVERNSAFDLRGSFSLVESMLADAVAVAGDDYRVVAWTSPPTPDEFQDGYAYAISRMSTDVPQGGMVIEEETWDAERVRRRDARLAAQGHMVSVACVQHVPTGVIAAYNELVITEADRTGATHQYGTLVLKEHRGRRLGTIVKCANLIRWRDLVTESPRVSTFNAAR